MEDWDEDECKVGRCDRCNTENVDVVADGYTVGFLCKECYRVVYAIY